MASHAVDVADREALKGAAYYIASIFVGHGAFDKSEQLHLSVARKVAAQMQAHYSNGRKAMVYAVVRDGRSVLVPDNYQPENEDKMIKTETTAEAKSYGKKSNAQRAARTALGKDAREGRDFATKQAGNAWTWEPLTAGAKADAQRAESRAKNEQWKANISDLNPTRRREVEKIIEQKKVVSSPKDKAATIKGKRAALEAAAADGKLPPAPDFTANTHKPYRAKLAEVAALVEAGDIRALKAYKINPVSTSPKAIDRYRNLAVIALQARAKSEKAAA